jgi:hypothetical protein
MTDNGTPEPTAPDTIVLVHGYGAAGVAIDSVLAEGVRVTPVSQIRSLFPILKNPANRHKAVGVHPEQFHYAFANTTSREESDQVYERYHIPASGRLVWVGATATFTPGHQENYVHFKNEDRAPLLFIAGARTTSCHRRSIGQTPSTTATPRARPTTRSSNVARTTA